MGHDLAAQGGPTIVRPGATLAQAAQHLDMHGEHQGGCSVSVRQPLQHEHCQRQAHPEAAELLRHGQQVQSRSTKGVEVLERKTPIAVVLRRPPGETGRELVGDGGQLPLAQEAVR